jgi:hypothetical protein
MLAAQLRGIKFPGRPDSCNLGLGGGIDGFNMGYRGPSVTDDTYVVLFHMMVYLMGYLVA